MNLTKSTTIQKSISMKRVAILKSMIQQAAQQSNADSLIQSNLSKKHQNPKSIHYNQNACHNKNTLEEKENMISSYNSQNQINKEGDQQFKKRPNAIFKQTKKIKLNFVDEINVQQFIQVQNQQKQRSSSVINSFDLKPKMLNSCSSAKTVKMRQLGQRKSKLLSQMKEMNMERFERGKKIGKGRFGSVYIAQDKLTKFILAIKIINKNQLKQANMEDQLLSEIKLQAFMKHPNILKMYGCFNDKTNIYLLIELAEQCLFSYITKDEGLKQNQVAFYSKQVCQALKYMHSQSIIHRDIKPQNILLVQGVAKLADFGWSAYSPLYKRQTFCGTLDYVCPQIVQGNYYDQKSDIWSLGVLIYELSVGNAPFQTEGGQKQTFKRILSGDLYFQKPLSQYLKKLIKQILVKDPKKRLSLKQIDNSEWFKNYQNQGRYISSQIWQFWNNNNN